jgi:hypothetical protein
MKIVKVSNLIIKDFKNEIIVFDPNTCQTHCLDSSINEIFQQLSCSKPTSLSQLKKIFMLSCQANEKSMLNDYIQDMIDSLLQLKLIHSCT